MLKTRVLTGAVLTVVVLAALYFSRYPYVMSVCAALLAFGAAWEVFGVCGAGRKSPWFVVCAVIAVLLPFVPISCFLPAAASVLGFAWLGCESRDFEGFLLPRGVVPILFSVLASLMLCAFPLLCGMNNGVYLLLLAFVACTATDTMAYFIGSRFGKHRLAPRVSPKKSVEGAVGGTMIALLLSLLYCYGAALLLHTEVNLGRAAVYTLLGSVAGQCGDLSLSVIKRIAGVKDYGRLFPGHGGVLDRFDSMLFCAPLTLLYVTLFPIF